MELLLDGEAVEAGKGWAASVRSALKEDGRLASGGWPGTLTEARSRAMTIPGATDLDPGAFDSMVAVLYGAARRDWQHHRETEAP